MAEGKPAFFYVIRDGGGSNHPTVSHLTHIEALDEAKRLARAFRGERFLVVRTVTLVQVQDVMVETFGDPEPDIEMPF